MIAVTNGASPKVIMVVEDDSLLRESLSLMLEGFGYRVVDAENAEEAIRLAVRSVNPVDLVFADVDIPGTLDGNGLAAWFTRYAPHVPVILTSGKVSAAPSGRCFLAKPVDDMELHRRIDELLGPWGGAPYR
ncbi:MAG: response regulator [Proteobacteria bacterium]|nr:response regulator [Pseudomonadota bacterium]